MKNFVGHSLTGASLFFAAFSVFVAGCQKRNFNNSANKSLGGQSAQSDEFVCGLNGNSIALCGHVPVIFIACDDSTLEAGQSGCIPEGSKKGRIYFYNLENGQPRTSDPLFSGIVQMRETVLGAKSGKTADRPCGDAFDAVFGSRNSYVLTTDPAVQVTDAYLENCHVEINTRLAGQITVSITPLFQNWKLPTNSVKPEKNIDAANPFVARSPLKAAYAIPDDAPPLAGKKPSSGHILYAMLDLYSTLRPSQAQVEGCLKNSRARDSQDLQQHFYCMLPKYPYRACLGGRIAAYKALPECATKQPDVAEAVDYCFVQSQLQNPDGSAATFFKDPKNAWRTAAFLDLFVVAPGLKDFDLEEQNLVIDQFYAALGQTRPRRVVDTWPDWSPHQPRYLALWKIQSEGLKKVPAKPEICTVRPTQTLAPVDD